MHLQKQEDNIAEVVDYDCKIVFLHLKKETAKHWNKAIVAHLKGNL